MGVPTIAALALTAAGTGLSMAAAKRTQREMNEVVKQQLAASEDFQRQATPEYQKSLGASGSRAATQALAEGEREALSGYQAVQSLPPTTSPSPLLSDSLTDVRTRANIGQANQAQAALQGYGNMALQSWLAQQGAQQNLGVISNLASSQARITPFLLANAQQKGQDMAAIGSLLGTAGSLAGVYGQLSPYLNPSPGNPPAAAPVPPPKRYPIGT